jgi:hypothetical protein
MVEFWMGGSNRVFHLVSEEDIDACSKLPKHADRFEYWRKVTGDPAICGHVLVWCPVERNNGRR